MLTKNEVCHKITEVFPDIGACGVDINVDYDVTNQAWAVDLKKGEHHLKTFLEIDEADKCNRGNCVSLGLQVAQLRDNIVTMTQV